MDPKIDLKNILYLHAIWLRGEAGGTGADLTEANLSGADLSGADLSRANLSGADLTEANLSGADLSGANLYRANLSRANLTWANLYRANLYRANLSGADLTEANLSDCRGADLALAVASHLPEGQFEAWKKCRDGVIVRLRIPAEARRSHGASRKCRAEYVEVLEVIGAEVGISSHDGKTEYRPGQIVRADGWDEDRWNTCSQGIHFFITRLEAEAYEI